MSSFFFEWFETMQIFPRTKKTFPNTPPKSVSTQPPTPMKMTTNGVKTLTPADFDSHSLIKKLKLEKYPGYRGALIVFHANWCGFCKRFVDPETPGGKSQLDAYAETAPSDILIAKIDCASYNNFFSQCPEVSKYPTIYYYNSKGEMDEFAFNGERTPQNLNAYISQCSRGSCRS
jgi:thiol-disulfide isomerase/thioredoxin